MADGSLGSVVGSLRLRDVCECENTMSTGESKSAFAPEKKKILSDLLTQAPDMEPIKTMVPAASRLIMSLAASRAQ